jgi:hypothetical protein
MADDLIEKEEFDSKSSILVMTTVSHNNELLRYVGNYL